MAINISGTTVINNSRQLQNIASVDSTTAASIGAAGVGGDTIAAYKTVYINSGSGSFVPSFSGKFVIALIGGGGGGAGTLAAPQGGGGGGGGAVIAVVNLTAGVTYTYTQGAGGNGVASAWPSFPSASGGGSSTFSGTNISLSGGGGGGAPYNAGGSAGSATASGSAIISHVKANGSAGSYTGGYYNSGTGGNGGLYGQLGTDSRYSGSNVAYLSLTNNALTAGVGGVAPSGPQANGNNGGVGAGGSGVYRNPGQPTGGNGGSGSVTILQLSNT